MKKIRVGGVPEHFNLPWHLNIEEGIFKKEGLEVTWLDFPGGTGAMCSALRAGEIDVSVILTEGIVKDIVAGNRVKIVQEYISSPLIWGVHVAANSGFQGLEDLKDQKVAISRYGSGSHLMAYINAKNMGWEPKKLEFEVVKDIDGGVEALKSGKAGYFMWEHFTTKPLVDGGVFRRLGDTPTPWPCFVIAVRQAFLEENKEAVRTLLQVLNKTTTKFKEIPAVEKLLAMKYDQKEEDIEEWLKLTRWSQKQISGIELYRVQDQLAELELIPEKRDILNFLHYF